MVSETPEFTTRSVYTVAMRGVVHVVENRQYVDPGTLVDKVVLLDGELRKVTALHPYSWATHPHSKAYPLIGLLVKDKR